MDTNKVQYVKEEKILPRMINALGTHLTSMVCGSKGGVYAVCIIRIF